MRGRPSARSHGSVPQGAGAVLLCLSVGALFSPSITAQQPAASAPESAACLEEGSGTVVHGFVQESGSGFVLAGAEVRLMWKRARGVTDTVRVELEAVADDRGAYVFCDVPPDTPLLVWARALGRTGAPTSLFLEGGDLQRQDLELRLGSSLRGAVVGTLIDAGTGEPLRAAQVWIERLGLSTTTDSEGTFELRDVPAGPQEVTVQHVGHGEQTVPLEIVPNRTRHMEIGLAPDPVELDPITVTVEMRPVWLEEVGFYDRKARSLGQFMGPEWMERRRPYRFSQVLEDVHGVRMSPMCQPHCSYMLRSTTQGGFCPLTFYMDGKRLRLGSVVDLDALVPASDVTAVEVYRGISQTPAQYYGRCGSVVIWTKRG